MAGFITLKCPTCGAGLHFEKDTQIFTCDHCGNNHLLEASSQSSENAAKEVGIPGFVSKARGLLRNAKLLALVIQSQKARSRNDSAITARPASFKQAEREWLRVGEYQIFLHEVVENQSDDQRVIYINIEYANPSSKEPLSCRRNQWLLFDQENYSYEAAGSNNRLYEDQQRPYFGGDRLLNLNMHARGWLAFIVRPTARLKRLQFFTGFLSTRSVDILLDGLKFRD